MTGKQFISTVKYVAGTKQSFSLSEIAVYLDEPQSVDHMYATLLPHLAKLGLTAEKTGGDYEISRLLPSPAYCLNAAEEQRLGEYLELRTLPPALEMAVEQYITRKTGKDWSDPVILERLRRAIVSQKDDYWKPTDKRSLQYTKGYSVLGYLAYHFPVYVMQTRHILAQLAREGLLKREMTILDLGTGPGVIPLAVADFWSYLDTTRAMVWPVERSKEHIEAFGALVQSVATQNSHVAIEPPREADIADPAHIPLPERVDLMVFSNVLNELAALPVAARADLVIKYAERLAPDGTILIIEPAEEATSTGLRVLALALKKRGLTIYAPCTFVWGTNCTPDRCWSFQTAPSIRPTRIMNMLAACSEPFRYVNTDIKYSYVMLRKDGKTRSSCHIPKDTRAPRLSKIHLNVGKRITVVAAKMSEDLGDNETHMFRLCDGSAEKPVYAVLPAFHITPENRELGSAPYGTVLEVRNVLVRYNPAHDAYNLLVSRDTQVIPHSCKEKNLIKI
ncbi:MAG: small ribosomal subunit Rsm22 family protein [Methanoregula sp.]|uniref:small ribosomal subunit Rsm22 family protein n=1 Tax=Methanoregula sp. TaxID=2052170 RepID=UPI003C78EBB5